MIKTKKELKFYILADRIMAGYDKLSFIKRIKYSLINPPILSYLKHMRCCSFYKNKRGFLMRLIFLYH